MAKQDHDVCKVLRVSETSQGTKDETPGCTLEIDPREGPQGTKSDSESSESKHALMIAKSGTAGQEGRVGQNGELTLIFERHDADFKSRSYCLCPEESHIISFLWKNRDHHSFLHVDPWIPRSAWTPLDLNEKVTFTGRCRT